MTISYNPKIITDGLLASWDCKNPRGYSPNVHPYPLDIYGWQNTPSGTNCTLARDTSTSISPAKGIPFKMTVTGNDPYLATYNSLLSNICPVLNGQTWCVSVYVKASVNTTCELFLFGADSAGSVGSYYSITSKTINVTTDWTRQEHYITMTNAAITNIHIRLDGPHSGGTGQIVWWDGLQVERGQTATTFNPNVNTNNTEFTNTLTSVNSTLANYPTYNSTGYLTFDGVDDYTQLENTNYPTNVTDSFSVECWLKVPTAATWSNGTAYGSILTRGTYAGSHGLIRHTTDNTVGFWLRDSATSVYSYTTISRDIWYQIVGTWDGLNKTSKMYKNGVLQHSVTNASLTGTFTSDTWWLSAIKAVSAADGNRFQGDISNIKIYNKELSALEVSTNFSALKGRFGL